MLHRRILSRVAVLFAVGAVACEGEPEPTNGPDVNAESSALSQNAVPRICKPPVSAGIGFRCPQAGCCLQKSNFTWPPTYFCYDFI